VSKDVLMGGVLPQREEVERLNCGGLRERADGRCH